MMIRIFDIFIASLGVALSFPVMLFVLILCFFDTGSPIFCQVRVGRFQKPFNLFKFRTMRVNTKQVATHLAPSSAITPLGHFLRRSKIDELPQLWNVLIGDMSIVGPRPCLPSQAELIQERQKFQIFRVRPGITGLAQLSQIDMSTPALLSQIDAQMLRTLNLIKYFQYIFLTIIGKGSGDRVRS